MWSKLKEQFNLLKLEKKRLYLVTNSDKFESKDIFLDAVASALQGGVDIIQLREKNASDGVIVDLGSKIRMLCDEYGATFIVNDRLDIASIVEADGVHLGRNDIPISIAREYLGPQAIIGKTVTCQEEIDAALRSGADYLSLGPVITDNTKIQSPVDMGLISWANSNSEAPIFIFGEFDRRGISEITYNGGKRIIVSEDVMYAKSPEHTARTILTYLP